MKRRGQITVIRRACYGQSALIDFYTIPAKYKDLIVEKYGNPQEQAVIKPFRDRIISDPKALSFFSNYTLSDGNKLTTKYIREYTANASVLNAIKEIYNNQTKARKPLGGNLRGFWNTASEAINNIRSEFGHTLPKASIPLKRKYQAYLEEGYAALISGKFCNDNSRKVTADIERLLLSLYVMNNKPFAADVHILYRQFMTGKISVACSKTGELFSPDQFIQDGHPVDISESTVWNYLNQPHNRIIVDKIRSGQHRYNSTVRPHHHRHAPNYSFSKITMDDRDLPRKCINGKWVKAYYAYDVASGCVVGYSHSFQKDEELFLSCLRDMFRLIDRESFPMPMEVEVENHLVNKFFDDLHIMFPFVRVCNPGNSQEKHAEHFNRQKKYGVEKKMQTGIGRWWSKHEAYTIDRDKQNDEFIEKTYTYERLIADDIESIKAYNNQLHPKQKLYPGKTRWQVLIENLNPSAPSISKAVVYKSIGERVKTTIRRSQYITVQYSKYQLPSVAVLDKLLPNDYTVEAYYMPNTDGSISDVYLYQNEKFLCKAEKIKEYNTAKAEWGDQDSDAYLSQSKYVSEFDKVVKEEKNKLISPVIINAESVSEAINIPCEIVQEPIKQEEDVLSDYNPEDYVKNAIDNL